MHLDCKQPRLTWDAYALNLALTASRRSEDPYVQVGACALDYENRVLGVAYNGLAPGKNVSKSFWKDRDKRRPFMIHAEANLLSLFRRGECRTIACTLLPCSACAAMIAGYGIERVIYKDIYARDTSAKDIFKFYNIELKQFK